MSTNENMVDEITEVKRYAFISYNHKDVKWAKWLQGKLESYKLPADIHNEFEDSRYLRPVFRDKTDLNTGVLANELRKELEESKFLIVVCSPNSAKSAWVSDEVKAFIEMGRLDRIIPFVVSGSPHNYTDRDCVNEPYDDECFPVFLRQYTKEHPEQELLGVSIDEVGKETAFIRVVSRMLAVNFDVLWKRHERQKKRRRILTAVTSLVVIAALVSVWFYNQPFDAEISYTEQMKNERLPFVDGSVMLVLENDTLRDSIQAISVPSEFKNIPRKYHNSKVRLVFNAFGFTTIDTVVELKSRVSLPIHRKVETYGLVQGLVLDANEQPVCGVSVSVMDDSAKTGKDGAFSLLIPLSRQHAADQGYMLKAVHGALQVEEKVYPVADNNINNTIYIQ